MISSSEFYALEAEKYKKNKISPNKKGKGTTSD